MENVRNVLLKRKLIYIYTIWELKYVLPFQVFSIIDTLILRSKHVIAQITL